MLRAIVEGIFNSQNLDAIVYPTRPVRPPLITAPPETPGGVAGNPVNLANLTGFPDLVVPAGFTADELPVTLSFLGRAFSEPFSDVLSANPDFLQLATASNRLPMQEGFPSTPRLSRTRAFPFRDLLALHCPDNVHDLWTEFPEILTRANVICSLPRTNGRRLERIRPDQEGRGS